MATTIRSSRTGCLRSFAIIPEAMQAMKLLKYVMTSDKGLAPNPYFGVCSLALCTPNHMNARVCVWRLDCWPFMQGYGKQADLRHARHEGFDDA